MPTDRQTNGETTFSLHRLLSEPKKERRITLSSQNQNMLALAFLFCPKIHLFTSIIISYISMSIITLIQAVLDSCMVRSWAPGFCIHKVRRSRQSNFLLSTLSERERNAFCSHLRLLEMRHQSTHLRHAAGPVILLMLQPWAHTRVAEPQPQLSLISTYTRKEKIVHLNLTNIH